MIARTDSGRDGCAGIALALGLALAIAFPAMAGLHDAEPIRPLPVEIGDVDPDRVALGERLFNDPRLSRDGRLACATCHHLDRGGDDGLPRGITNSGEPDIVNTPTVFNARYNFRLTWRGKFRTLEAQAEGALRNPRHGATDWPELLPKLRQDPEYRRAFAKAYPQGITRESVLDAIASFERTLVTPNAPFDRWLRGDARAVDAEVLRGYELFRSYGCIACHQGMNVGGNMFQKFGVFREPAHEQDATPMDEGRFTLTGDEADRGVFRVPSLRNVAVTAPYFHDGEVTALDEAIRVMGEVQLGIEIPPADRRLIKAFLHSLTGEYQGRSLAEARP
ncbi:cytochrome-c peroxidase [Thiohalobacter sp.]|uniref:cytochrome-c peroxidase n=1 Tax=Thiohalobacter sp. TaxID=2025948 RepID=UPI002610494A|nr:cytochrome c peroxidase [Thiohalobacter sp.]